MRLLLPFHSYEHSARQVASRRLVNCHAEAQPAQGKAPVCLMRSPGLRAWATLPTGPVRGMATHKGVLYVVAGSSLYRLASDGTYASLGTIPGTARVSMASNGIHLIVVARPRGFVFDGTLSEITDPDFVGRGASQVAMLDSFALFIEPNSGRFFHSDLLDATSYDSLNFATAEAYPDNVKAIIVDHRQIFLFGEESVELWFNAGTAGSPFAREANGVIEVGCGAADSPAKADNTVMWLDNHGIARRLADLTPQRISTHALEQRWQGYSRYDDAFGFAFVQDGHTFYALTFPSGGDTFIFDAATNEWHERRSRLVTGGDSYWRANAHTYAYGMNIIGDSRSGMLGVLDPETYTELGLPLRMEWTYPNVYSEGRRAFHHRLEIELQSGVGLASGQGSNPEVMLYASNDGGMTFDALPGRSFGQIGEYRYRSTWNRLGTAEDRIYRAAVSDPVPVTVWDTHLEVDNGRL